MACAATCFCGSCLIKVRMFYPRTQRRGRRSCPHRHRIRTGLFEPKSPLLGNGISRAETKGPETALEIQGRRCRDKISPGNSANSGLIARFREISVRTRVRGGPGRTRTANQIVMKWSRRSPSAAWLGAYATAPGDFSDIVRTQKRTLRHQLAPPSQVLDIANLVARPKRFELLTPRFVV